MTQQSVVVISQPMLFPWVGMFEQIMLADTFLFYEDVQFSKGSFVNRVQILLPETGSKWLTIPLNNRSLGTQIDALEAPADGAWKAQHLEFLKQIYQHAPFGDEMLELVRETYYHSDTPQVSVYLKYGLLRISDYLGLSSTTRFLNANELKIGGRSSQRVLDIVKAVKGTVYLTAHGARNYLDHQAFEDSGIEVRYMNYTKKPYPQFHRSTFEASVSILDLIANLGPQSSMYLKPDTLNWKEFLNHE